MNNFIIMAEIIDDPQLRYTSDNQLAVSEMTVQFEGLRDDDPPTKLKVISWGNLAQEIQSNYHSGDRVILEGRLGMNTIDRPEGFKEKRAEMTVQRLYRLEAGTTFTTYEAATEATEEATAQPVVAESSPAPARAPSRSANRPAAAKAPAPTPPPVTPEGPYDDIPF